MLRLVPLRLASVAVGLLVAGVVLLAAGAEAAAFFVGGVGGILAAGAAFYAVGRSEDRERARGEVVVVALRLLRIPIWMEARVALEHAALMRDPVLRGEGVAHGEGAPVLLVPGFLAGDPSLTTMARWLRRIGYRPCRAQIRVNVDCTARGVERLESQLERHATRHGRRVAVVGQSRGGTMARLLAVRRPDLVERIVCLGSPLTDQLAIHPLVRAQVTAVGLLGTVGVPGLFARACQTGDCCADVRDEAQAPMPAGVDFVSIYSRTDGIVDWRACLDPAARHVEVRATHVGMALNPQVFRAVADALSDRSALPAAA